MLPLLLLLLADGPPGGDEWKYDAVRLRDRKLVGLVVEQTKSSVRIRCIRRKPGAPTILHTETIDRDDVLGLDLLEPEDRKKLEARLDALKRERELLAALTRSLDPRAKPAGLPTDLLVLKKASWPADESLEALRYGSSHFELVAACRPELVQLSALHLEQCYAAFARALPPRVEADSPTTVLLTRSLTDYHAIAKARGLNLFNPAFYDPDRNQVVCGSDLDRLCDERDKVRAHHAALRAGIAERRKELKEVYKGKPPAGLTAPLADAEKRIEASEAKNAAVLARVRERLFQRLSHEAFHAYLGTFVYPGKENAVPVWLNEGLAQIFETAIVEVGELRIGHADPDRLKAAKKALEEGKLPSLDDLLRSGPKEFQVAHAAEQQAADRHYLASWALAHYLTFDRQLLGKPALHAYVKALGREADPRESFAELVGGPLPKFEESFQSYLRKLRESGSVSK